MDDNTIPTSGASVFVTDEFTKDALSNELFENNSDIVLLGPDDINSASLQNLLLLNETKPIAVVGSNNDIANSEELRKKVLEAQAMLPDPGMLEEASSLMDVYKQSLDIINKLHHQLEKLSDVQNRLIMNGHGEIEPWDLNACKDTSIEDVMNQLKEGAAAMKEHAEAAGLTVDHGEVNNDQRVYTFKVDQQVMIYGILYKTVSIFPKTIKLKKMDRNAHVKKLEKGDTIRILDLPYKVLDVQTGKLTIENKYNVR